ncbi:Mannosyl-glycoprotein endo-beta-N-acetylglucosaminidase [Aphelenchoides fujianensis]|nr:Mannosyl-glycoprotein endo-beta-N-acetylglucosaminidase [Aphelenchoides fujianensis]
MVTLGENEQKPFIYAFYWYTDLFVYFSHHFLTVPTVRFINECHDHDVLCLGTFITESARGQAICAEIFADERHVEQLVAHMVALADEFFFDGYLINVENTVDAALVGNLVLFVRQLRLALKKRVGEHAQVVWYDSVVLDGDLQWQNCLNEKNVVFADVADGFYANYTWKKDHLKYTQRFLDVGKSTVRPSDVYFGIDVFGRGSFGGGQFNSHTAVQAARNFGFSVAIFAPGWTTECFAGADVDGVANHEDLFKPMADLLHPHRLCRSFDTKFDLGLRSGRRFDPARRTIFPFMLESDFRLTEAGVVIHGPKDSTHTLFLTDFRCISSYELDYGPKDELIVGVRLENSAESFVRACPFVKRYDVWEIYCVKLTDEPVTLSHLSFKVRF